MTLWELRYKIESHVQVWHALTLLLILAMTGLFFFVSRRWP